MAQFNSMTLDYIDGCQLERDGVGSVRFGSRRLRDRPGNPNIQVDDFDELSERKPMFAGNMGAIRVDDQVSNTRLHP
jgi:hypothetical protein